MWSHRHKLRIFNVKQNLCDVLEIFSFSQRIENYSNGFYKKKFHSGQMDNFEPKNNVLL